jgi:hypothetical protein
MLSRASGLVYGSRVPEEGRELVLEVSEGIEIVEEDREHSHPPFEKIGR